MAPKAPDDALGESLDGKDIMLIHGSCHCGNITFALHWPADAEPIAARACTCAFCRKHGAVWTASPEASLDIVVADPAKVSLYAFETRTAQFHACVECGVVPVCTSRIDDHLYAVVNVHAFDDLDPDRLTIAPVSFDGEQQDARLERRARRWIGRVTVNGSSA